MKITIIGAGSWGTALAIHFALHGHKVAMWSRNTQHMEALRQHRENPRYLPGIPFPEQLNVYTHIGDALHHTNLIIIATPIAGLRSSAGLLVAHRAGQLPVLSACKGFEQGSGLLGFQVLEEVLSGNTRIGILSGPSFAQELAQQHPCAVVLASANKAWIKETVSLLNTNILRLYGSSDIIGAAVGGAVKNIMAIAAGLADGLGYGFNARAALITRGLAETTRLAVTMGAQPETLMGLAGVGDLILTCTGALSRNRRVGLGLAEGKTLQQILAEIGHVSEGINTLEEVFNAACKYQTDMPITQALYRLIRQELDARQVVEHLMERETRFE